MRPVEMPDREPFALVGGRRHVDGRRERIGEALEAAVVAARLGQFVEPPLRLLDLVPGRGLHGRVEGHVDHVLADGDQVPAHREVVDGAAVILRVDDRGRLGGEAGEVLRDGDAAQVLIAQEGLHGDRRRDLAGLDQARGHLVDAPVQVLDEVRGLEEVRDPVIGVVVDQDRAQERLFGVDVAGGRAELRLGGFEAGDQGIGGGHLALRKEQGVRVS
jgi:hypothetical protein